MEHLSFICVEAEAIGVPGSRNRVRTSDECMFLFATRVGVLVLHGGNSAGCANSVEHKREILFGLCLALILRKNGKYVDFITW
jgi:hypothetical protein